MEKTKRVFNICTEEFLREKDIIAHIKRYCDKRNVSFSGSVNTIIISGGVDNDNVHTYKSEGREYYKVEGITIDGIDEIRLFISRGDGTSMDSLIYVKEGDSTPNPKESPDSSIEKTKVSPKESGNCGQYQRLAKSLDIDYYPDLTDISYLYISDLYGDKEMEAGTCKADIFEERFFRTFGYEWIGKKLNGCLPFTCKEDIISTLNGRKKVSSIPEVNWVKSSTPVHNLAYYDEKTDTVWVSIKLVKKMSKKGSIKEKYTYNHDPAIGLVVGIGKAFREGVGFNGNIVLTSTGLDKVSIPKKTSCKLFRALKKYNINVLLSNGEYFELPECIDPEFYWKYEDSSEKVCDIEVAYQLKYFYRDGLIFISLNIAGTEKSYVLKKDGTFIPLPGNSNIKIPDECFGFKEVKKVDLVEGKKFDTIKAGIDKIPSYDGYIRFIRDVCGYDDYTFNVGVSVFCPFPLNTIDKVLENVSESDRDKIWYCKDSTGKMFFNTSCPEEIRKAFN